ncbi:MAG: ATP-binding protein [Candidatus Thermoplasmatota archaeon]|nr:ATP-binding protein [Candidatus Thermoplasmatota archaeon]
MIKEGLAFWNPWWDGNTHTLKEIRERKTINDIPAMFDRKEVLVFTGVRRSGKTSMMHLLVKQLLDSLDPAQIMYVNLDDPTFKEATLQDIYQAYEELMTPVEKKYLFLDEVQNMEGWEKWVKKMYDSHEQVKIVVTGSNSSLLRTEYSSYLAGRSLSCEVYPLSFGEYLGFKGKEIRNELQMLNMRPVIIHHLEEYLKFGGYPEVVLEGSETMKTTLLKEYFSAILSRDILTRYDIKEWAKLEKLAAYLMTNVCAETSAKSLSKVIGLNIKTIQEYLSHLEDVYLFSFVNHFSYSLKAQFTYPRKIYCIDAGMKNAVSFNFSKDKGKLLENIVYMKLRRLGEVYYWKSRDADIDFVLKQERRVTHLIQACYDLKDEKTKKREVSSLLKAMDHFNIGQGTIITWDEEGTDIVDDKEIHYKPLWKWLLKETV